MKQHWMRVVYKKGPFSIRHEFHGRSVEEVENIMEHHRGLDKWFDEIMIGGRWMNKYVKITTSWKEKKNPQRRVDWL